MGNAEPDRPASYKLARKRYSRKFYKVEALLKSTFRKYSLDKDIAKYHFILYWKEIVGEDIAKRSKPGGFQGKTLVVNVCDAAWANELVYHKKTILTRLRKYLDDTQIVDDIYFHVGGV